MTIPYFEKKVLDLRAQYNHSKIFTLTSTIDSIIVDSFTQELDEMKKSYLSVGALQTLLTQTRQKDTSKSDQKNAKAQLLSFLGAIGIPQKNLTDTVINKWGSILGNLPTAVFCQRLLSLCSSSIYQLHRTPQELALFCRLTPTAPFVLVIAKLYKYAGTPVISYTHGAKGGKYDTQADAVCDLDLAKLFIGCCSLFGIEKYRDMHPSITKPNLNSWANSIKTQMTLSSTYGTVVERNNPEFSLRYGLSISLTRTFNTNDKQHTQTIFLKVDDPKLCGLSLWYSESEPELDVSFACAPKMCRSCDVKIPSIMISNWEAKATSRTIDTMLKLENEGITVVTTEPSKITTKQIQEQLMEGKWLGTAIIDWWLEYWCKLLPDTTFYSGSERIRRESRNNTLIQQKFVCAGALCYQQIWENNPTDELYRFDIFQCLALLMPVNMGKNHWVLAQIKFSIETPANVEIAWFDSLVNSKDSHGQVHTAKFKSQIKVLKAWLTKKYNGRPLMSSEGGAASAGAAADTLNFKISTGKQSSDQSNGVDCGAWVCMYASYLSLGSLPDENMTQKLENGTRNINYVRRWMLHCMDARGQDTDGGQSKEVQSVATGEGTRDHTVKNAAGVDEGHISVPGTPANVELESLKKTAEDMAQKANDILTACQAKLEAATKKQTEVEQVKLMTKSVTDTKAGVDKNIQEIEASYKSAERDKTAAALLLDTINGFQSRQLTEFKEADDVVTQTLSMSNPDGCITWAIEGSTNAKTYLEGVKTETTNLQGSVKEKLDLAGTSIEQRTAALAKCTRARQNLMTIRQTIEGQGLSWESQIVLYEMQVSVAKLNNTEMNRLCDEVAQVSTTEEANYIITSDVYTRLSEKVSAEHDKHTQASTEPLEPETMTQQELKDKTELENNSVLESVTSSNNASAAAAAALVAATAAATSILSLQARQTAARDVAVAFQEAAAACVEVETLKSMSDENTKLNSASTEEMTKLNAKMAGVKVKYDALTSKDGVEQAFITAESAVNTAIEHLKSLQTQTGHFTRHYSQAANDNAEAQQAVAKALLMLDGMKSNPHIDQQLLDLTTHKDTARIKTKNASENSSNAINALELARTKSTETKVLVTDVQNKFKIFEDKYNNAVRPEPDAAAPEAGADPVVQEPEADAAAAVTAAAAPTLAQLKQSFAAIEADERFKKKAEYVTESRQIVDKYEQMAKTFQREWVQIWPDKIIRAKLVEDNKEILMRFEHRKTVIFKKVQLFKKNIEDSVEWVTDQMNFISPEINERYNKLTTKIDDLRQALTETHDGLQNIEDSMSDLKLEEQSLTTLLNEFKTEVTKIRDDAKPAADPAAEAVVAVVAAVVVEPPDAAVVPAVVVELTHPAGPPAAPAPPAALAPDPSFKELCDSKKILYNEEMKKLDDIVKQFNQTLAICKLKYLEFQAKYKSDSLSTKTLFDKNTKKFETYMGSKNKFLEQTRNITNNIMSSAKEKFSKVSNLTNPDKQKSHIEFLVLTIQTITTEILRLTNDDLNYSNIVKEMTDTIVLMTARIQDAKTAADTAALAKQAAEDLAKAAQTAAAAKAQADRFTQQKTRLEGEVTKVTDDTKQSEDSWTSLKASASMTGLAKQVTDSEAIFAKIQEHAQASEKTYKEEMAKLPTYQNQLPADWIDQFKPVLNINNSVQMFDDIKLTMSKIELGSGDITRNSTEIDTLFQTIRQHITDASANVQITSLTQANADKSLAESNLKKVETNMKRIKKLLASMIPNMELLKTQRVALETSLKNVLIKVEEVFKAAQDAVAAIGPASAVVPAAVPAAVPAVVTPLPTPLPTPVVVAPVVVAAARKYGERVYPIRNGVLTYYVVRENLPMPRLPLSSAMQRRLFGIFDLPPETSNVKIEVKEAELARYEIAPITLEAEVTFTLWEKSATSYDVFYCGMYKPGPIALATGDIHELKSPPDLPAA